MQSENMNGEAPRNEERVGRIETTLTKYKTEQLKEGGAICDDTLVDFLTDLRHYCDAKGFDIDAALDLSSDHFLVEKEEEAGARLKM
ncbi:hypothetical protein [Chromobacterium haemolyticum]|uniref:hypothetical protein n=1 Tax=Chromobacterium haemolyticum TaxID=394935 RepID=UPI00244BD443|nr:hypothetical protein [Chromobacterium haemolyticum]MDH0341987.1 hypothetical protein [Chromobacterium haemolyticum]